MRKILWVALICFAIIGAEGLRVYAQTFFISSANGQAPAFPSGGIILIDTGSCPATFDEVTAFNAHVVRGTLAANVDVGGTGGNDSYTPAGTVAAPTFTGSAATLTGSVAAPTFTGSAGTVGAHTISWPAGVPTFAGDAFSSIINHTHTATVTDPGHVHVQTVNSGTTGGLSGYGVDSSTSTPATSGYSTASATTGVTVATSNPAGGVSSITPTGTNAWPAGVPTMGTVSFTPAGTNNAPALTMNSYTPAGTNNAPSFTGSGVTVIPSYLKLIACKKQ